MLQPFTEKSYFIYIKWQLCYNESAFCKASETQNVKILRRVEHLKEVKLEEAAYQFDGKMSLHQAIPLGLQHVLAMFVGNLTPILIITGACAAGSGAEELAAATPKSFIPAQFDNPANPEAHYLTTGPELWRDTDGCVDLFVAGIGTGGTFSGTGRYLKEKNPDVKLVAVEPAGSPLLSGGKAGPHGLMGIGANFIPKNMDVSLIDEIVCVREEDAYAAGRDMVACEGVLVGITAGAALWAATQLALRPENAGKTIVALLPDGGERYLSTPMYQGE